MLDNLNETDLYPTRGKKEEVVPRQCPVVYGAQNGPQGGHALDAQELKSFEKNGFIIIPDAFSEAEVDTIYQEYRDLVARKDLHERDEFIMEPDSAEARSIFNPHQFSKLMDLVSRDRRILDKVHQILGSGAYIHHGRINIKKALSGKSFPWHSDFETWHAEDGMPHMRAVSGWVMLTDNNLFNGPLFLIPGSHKQFVACAGETPDENFKSSLRKQEYGVPSKAALDVLLKDTELAAAIGKKGTLVLHECNTMHGSPDNMSNEARTNLFFVYNSVENTPAAKPYAADSFRPGFLSSSDHRPLIAVDNAFD